MRSRLGKEAPAKEALVKDALAKEALARRPLVRKMMTKERGACKRSAGRRGTELGGVGFGSADQPEHWAWTDRSKMANGLRCAEFKGAGLRLEVLDWLGYA